MGSADRRAGVANSAAHEGNGQYLGMLVGTQVFGIFLDVELSVADGLWDQYRKMVIKTTA